jgi:hypothetical protein
MQTSAMGDSGSRQYFDTVGAINSKIHFNLRSLQLARNARVRDK